MSLDIGSKADGSLIVIQDEKKILILSENETKNLFFYIVKHKTELFSEIKDDDLRKKIHDITVGDIPF